MKYRYGGYTYPALPNPDNEIRRGDGPLHSVHVLQISRVNASLPINGWQSRSRFTWCSRLGRPIKLGGAPGTLLACGIAPDSIPCAIRESRCELHTDSGSPDRMFLQGHLLTGDCLVITLYVMAARTLGHGPQIWFNPLIRAIVFPKEFADV